MRSTSRVDCTVWETVYSTSTGSGARRSSVALLRNLRTVKHWVDQAGSVRFFDDEYDASQLMLRIWELLGEGGYRRALAIAADIESLDGLVDNRSR